MGGKSVSFSAIEKPIPCIIPKAGIINKLHLFRLLCAMFSMELIKMEIAMRGSIILESGSRYPDAVSQRVMLCARVNSEHGMITVFKFEFKSIFFLIFIAKDQ